MDMQNSTLLSRAGSSKWLVNITNILMLVILGVVVFIVYSGGAVLEPSIFGLHVKISLRRLANPLVFLVIISIIRFLLWWSRVGASQASDDSTGSEKGDGPLQPTVNAPTCEEAFKKSDFFLKENLLVMAIVLIVTFITCNWIYTTYLTHTSRMVTWDMAEHGFWGIKIASAIEDFDLRSFVFHTNEQRLWPFVHSYLLAGFFLLFDSSVDTATLLSICAFSLIVFILFLTSVNLAKRDGWFVAVLACFLALTSKLYLVYSTLVMLEIFGALFTLVSLLLYFRAMESGSNRYYALTSISIAALFLIKYNYGILLIVVILFMEYTNLPNRNLLNKIIWSFVKEVLFVKKSREVNVSLKSIFPSKIYYLFMPALLVLLFWFAYPYPHKINGLLGFVFKKNYLSQTAAMPFFSLNNIFYYPKVISDYYSISQGVFIVAAILFLSSLFKTRDPKIIMLRNFFLFALFLSTMHSLKGDRFIFTILPAFWLVAAYQANRIIMSINLNVLRNNAVGVKILVVVLVGVFSYSNVSAYRTSFPAELSSHFADERLRNVFDYIESRVDKKSRVLFLGSFSELSPGLIPWELSGNRGFMSENISIDELPRGDRKSHLLDPSKMPDKYMDEFNRWMKKPDAEYVVGIEVLGDSQFNGSDYKTWNIWKMNYIYLLEHKQSEYKIVSERLFDEMGLNIKIFKK